MKIKIVGSAVDGAPHQFAASYVVNESLAIDAGSLGFMSVEAQRRIKNVLITHSHLDHIASLPVFLENVYAAGPEAVSVYAGAATIECLKSDFFNGRVWPDLIELSEAESPHVELVTIEARQTIELDGARITPVQLDHTVPTLGFIVEDEDAALALVSDTGPTREIWERANAIERLKMVIIESAFPDSMEWLAVKSKHLTPARLAAEVRKLNRQVPLLVVHVKPAYYHEVVSELEALRLPLLAVSEPNREYEI